MKKNEEPAKSAGSFFDRFLTRYLLQYHRHGGENMTTVYVDRVFVLNLVTDYLLLLATARLAGIPLRRGRLMLSALLGAGYAVAVFLPGCAFLAGGFCKVLSGAFLALAAFWPQRHLLRLTALFLLLSGALAGLLLALALMSGSPGIYLRKVYRAEISWTVLITAAVIFYVLLSFLFRRSLRHGGGDILRVTVRIGEKKRDVFALHDTGNTLCDPVNGNPVLVLEQSAVCDLWPTEVQQVLLDALTPEEKMVRLHRMKWGRAFCLLPYRSVGVPAGLLLAFRSDRVTVENSPHPKTLVALSEGPLSDGGGYQALWGGEEGRIHGKHMACDPTVGSSLDHAG